MEKKRKELIRLLRKVIAMKKVGVDMEKGILHIRI